MPSLIPIDFLKAQGACNFIVFETSWLPGGMEITNQQLRAESVGEFASYRFEIAGKGRRLSMKQFLYDWAPPAYDHPSLWRNAKISKVEDTPLPKPYLVGHNIAWIGLNFRRQRGASLNKMRTMIEMTVMEGDFSDEELITIYQHLRPVDQESMNRILSTPFACLCKAYRYKEKASNVPLSYWKYTRKDTNVLLPTLPASTASIYREGFKNRDVLEAKTDFRIMSGINGYHLNSIFHVGTEIEYYYERGDLAGSYIRLLTIPPLKPVLGDQVCHSRVFNMDGTNIHHAYLTEEFGPHEALWRSKDKTMLLLIKPASWTNLEWFQQVIGQIV